MTTIYSYYIYSTTTAQCKLQLVVITTCVSGVFVPVDGRKDTTSTSCKRSGPALVQIGVGCTTNMHLQPPPPPTRSGPACTGAVGVTNATIKATCVRLNSVPYYVIYKPWLCGVFHVYTTRETRSKKVCSVYAQSQRRGAYALQTSDDRG